MNKKEYDREYRRTHFKTMSIDISKELADRFKETCVRKGKTMTEVIRTAIEKFIEEK